MTGLDNVALELWSDEPSAVDLLAFAAVAETVVDAVLDDALDPVALGISGSWGSGKTTVLRLIEIAVSRPPKEGEGKVLAVATDPWRYDPTVGAKESLIAGVLDALQKEIIDTRGPAAEALGLLRRLARRVDWAKAIKVAAKASLAFQLPSVNDITDLIRTEPDDGGESEPRGLEAFREEFSRLMASEDLGHVRRVVVLVDDLDRCLPDTVVETLETIRLFLAVPKMAFVIAADEERVPRRSVSATPAAQAMTWRSRPSSTCTRSSRRPSRCRASAASTPRPTYSFCSLGTALPPSNSKHSSTSAARSGWGRRLWMTSPVSTVCRSPRS